MIDLYYAPHAERLESLDHAEELRLPYTVIPVNIPGWRSVQAGISRDQPEQSHSRGSSIKCAFRRGEPFSVFENRRHPDLSRREDRPLPPCGHALALRW